MAKPERIENYDLARTFNALRRVQRRLRSAWVDRPAFVRSTIAPKNTYTHINSLARMGYIKLVGKKIFPLSDRELDELWLWRVPPTHVQPNMYADQRRRELIHYWGMRHDGDELEPSDEATRKRWVKAMGGEGPLARPLRPIAFLYFSRKKI